MVGARGEWTQRLRWSLLKTDVGLTPHRAHRQSDVGLRCAGSVGFACIAGRRSGCHALGVSGRILVVDDSPQFRAAAAKLLAIRGLEPFGLAAGGEEALAAVEANSPDGVLLDINLPGLDGFEVATALAARWPAVPIVLMSSETDGVENAELQRCGAQAFVPKTELATTDLELLFRQQPGSQ
jgi:CheY-like chemotaxis protein